MDEYFDWIVRGTGGGWRCYIGEKNDVLVIWLLSDLYEWVESSVMPRLQHMERECVTKWPSMRSEKFSAEGRRISVEKFSFVAVEFKEVVAGFNVCRTVC